jgi:hypothetical protein
MSIKASETTLNVNTSEAGFVSRSLSPLVAVKVVLAALRVRITPSSGRG